MERLRMLLLGKVFFLILCASVVVITEGHRDERTDGRAGWLAPRPGLALMFRKLPEKKHGASKGGYFASTNQPAHHEGGSPTDINGANHAGPYSDRSTLEQQGPFPRPLLEILCCM